MVKAHPRADLEEGAAPARWTEESWVLEIFDCTRQVRGHQQPPRTVDGDPHLWRVWWLCPAARFLLVGCGRTWWAVWLGIRDVWDRRSLIQLFSFALFVFTLCKCGAWPRARRVGLFVCAQVWVVFKLSSPTVPACQRLRTRAGKSYCQYLQPAGRGSTVAWSVVASCRWLAVVSG